MMSPELIEAGRQEEIAERERQVGLSRDREENAVPPRAKAVVDLVLERVQCIPCADAYFEKLKCSTCGARAKSFASMGRPHLGCTGRFLRTRDDVEVIVVEEGSRCSTCKAVL
jgi:hypothetical protein